MIFSTTDCPSPVYRLALICSLTFGLLACGSVNEMVFDQNRKTYVHDNKLTGKDSVHVLDQRVYRGMPTEHALAALGRPDESDTTNTEDGREIRYIYESGPNAFDPGNLKKGYLYTNDGAVTDWEDLDKIPRLDAYYEGGL